MKPEPCCDMMRDALSDKGCVIEHRQVCPDIAVVWSDQHGYGLPIRDGGSSQLSIRYCPWCGRALEMVNPRPHMDVVTGWQPPALVPLTGVRPEPNTWIAGVVSGQLGAYDVEVWEHYLAKLHELVADAGRIPTDEETRSVFGISVDEARTIDQDMRQSQKWTGLTAGRLTSAGVDTTRIVNEYRARASSSRA